MKNEEISVVNDNKISDIYYILSKNFEFDF